MLFHFAQSIWKHIKKYNLTDINNKQETLELALNLKRLNKNNE